MKICDSFFDGEISQRPKGFLFWNHNVCPSQLFRLLMNTYVMGLWPVFCETQWRHRKPFWMGTRWKHVLVTLPSQVRPSDYHSDLDNRCAWGLYEKEGVRASWIFIMTSPVYWPWYGGHTQVRLFGLQELGREEGGSELIAHIRDIKESAGSRQLDRWRWY